MHLLWSQGWDGSGIGTSLIILYVVCYRALLWMCSAMLKCFGCNMVFHKTPISLGANGAKNLKGVCVSIYIVVITYL